MMGSDEQRPAPGRAETEASTLDGGASMHPETPAKPVAAPGPVIRALMGIVVRDGTFYWSGAAQLWRAALLVFLVKLLMRIHFNPPNWRAEPEWLGIPYFSMPYAGMAALTTPLIAGFIVLTSMSERRRFNRAALPAPAPRRR
jgi:hypothetical protein